jgi:hypothetical protein
MTPPFFDVTRVPNVRHVSVGEFGLGFKAHGAKAQIVAFPAYCSL